MNHHGCCLLPQTAFVTAVVADWTAHTVTFLQLAVAFPARADLAGVVTTTGGHDRRIPG